MTPEQRSKEMKRRRKVALAKKGEKKPPKAVKAAPVSGPGGKTPRGFWFTETSKMLAQGAMPQRDVSAALRLRFPEKREAISVALATMKHNKQLVERDGLLTMGNGAAQA